MTDYLQLPLPQSAWIIFILDYFYLGLFLSWIISVLDNLFAGFCLCWIGNFLSWVIFITNQIILDNFYLGLFHLGLCFISDYLHFDYFS